MINININLSFAFAKHIRNKISVVKFNTITLKLVSAITSFDWEIFYRKSGQGCIHNGESDLGHEKSLSF